MLVSNLCLRSRGTVITSRFYSVHVLISLGGVDEKFRFLFVRMVLGVGNRPFSKFSLGRFDHYHDLGVWHPRQTNDVLLDANEGRS